MKENAQQGGEKEAQLWKIIFFRNAQIPQIEANILQEIEKQLNKQFTLFKSVEWI